MLSTSVPVVELKVSWCQIGVGLAVSPKELRKTRWLASLSVTPPPDHPGYDAFERALHIYFDSYAVDEIFTMPTACRITAARFRSE